MINHYAERLEAERTKASMSRSWCGSKWGRWGEDEHDSGPPPNLSSFFPVWRSNVVMNDLNPTFKTDAKREAGSLLAPSRGPTPRIPPPCRKCAPEARKTREAVSVIAELMHESLI